MILDIFMAMPNDFIFEDLELYAVTCLLIAAKSQEKDQYIPRSSQLMKHLTQSKTYDEIIYGLTSTKIVKCEREILKAINWDYENYPTFYSIIELFRSQGLLYDSDIVLPYILQNEDHTLHILVLVDKYIELFSLLILQTETFINVNPYLITCALLAVSRKSAGIHPEWPQELI